MSDHIIVMYQGFCFTKGSLSRVNAKEVEESFTFSVQKKERKGVLECKVRWNGMQEYKETNAEKEIGNGNRESARYCEGSRRRRAKE